MPTIGSITELAVPLTILFTCLLSTKDKTKAGLYRYPFIFYLVPILTMFGIYELIRALISLIHSDKSVAFANARVIYELQSAMGLATFELDLQAWALQFSWLISICNHFYKQSHWAGSSLFCFYFFKWRRQHFPFCFSWFLACNLLAFVGFVIYPMAPPRLCEELGIVDTIRVVGGYTRKMLDNPLVNNFAAMPSMHFGYSFFYASAYVMSLYWSYSESEVPLPSNRNSNSKGLPEWRKQFIVLSLLLGYQMFMMFAIMVTGNHFFLDGIAGMITVVFAFMLSHITYTGSLKLFSKGCHISELDSKNSVEGLGSFLFEPLAQIAHHIVT